MGGAKTKQEIFWPHPPNTFEQYDDSERQSDATSTGLLVLWLCQMCV